MNDKDIFSDADRVMVDHLNRAMDKIFGTESVDAIMEASGISAVLALPPCTGSEYGRRLREWNELVMCEKANILRERQEREDREAGE